MSTCFRVLKHERQCLPRSRVVWILASLLLLLVAPNSVRAQQTSMTIEGSPIQPPVVIGRPMLTWWDVKIQGPGLIVGQFEFVLSYNGRELAISQTEEFTLNGPEQRIRVMLPLIDETYFIDQLQVQISFRGKSQTTKLGDQVLRIPFASKKVFLAVIGDSKAIRRKSLRRDRLMEQLRFENLLPAPKLASDTDERSEYVKTVYASLDPADFPAEPLAYCGYDLVVLIDEDFRSLRKPQLEALLSWTRAGGSVYIEPGGVLEPYHVEFLRNLVGEEPEGLMIQSDAAGKLPKDTIPDQQLVGLFRYGLGHAAIRTDDSDRELAQAANRWRAVIAHLWNVRRAPHEQPPANRVIVGANNQPVQIEATNFDPFGFSMHAHTRFRLSITELLYKLLPDGVRMVPLSVLALILCLFVVLIGPGDYYILGWLHLRKLTWLTFPAATLIVTALTVWVSNNYMSAAESRRAVEIRDLDHQGDIVRTNRLELLYLATTRRVVTDVEKGVFSSFSTSGGMQALTVNGGVVYSAATNQPVFVNNLPMPTTGFGIGSDGMVGRAVTPMQGRMPTQYVVNQDLGKWTPQLNRIMSIPGPATRPNVAWDDFQLTRNQQEQLRLHQLPAELLKAAESHFGPTVMVACASGKNDWAYNYSPEWTSQQMIRTIGMRGTELLDAVELQLLNEPDFFRWIYSATVAPAKSGLFALTRQTTPKGNPYCDDLPILDSTDPDSWVLIVVVPDGDNYVVYRKRMRFQD